MNKTEIVMPEHECPNIESQTFPYKLVLRITSPKLPKKTIVGEKTKIPFLECKYEGLVRSGSRV